MNKDINSLLDSADTLMAVGNHDKALAVYEQIIEVDKHCDEAYLLRGELYGKLGKFEQALADVLHAISIDASYDYAYMVLASLYVSQGDITKGIEACLKAVKLEKQNRADAVKQLAHYYVKQGDEQLAYRPQEALISYRAALNYVPENIHYLYKYAFSLSRNGEFDDSKQHIKRIFELDSQYVPARNLLVDIYDKTGEIEKGWNISCALASEYPDNTDIIISFAKSSLRNKQQQKGILKLANLLETHKNISNEDKLSAHMLLGRLYDSISDYAKAFTHFSHGNNLKYNDYDVAEFAQQVSAVINYLSLEIFDQLPSSNNSSADCLFILGMPRSGTSLIEQIVSSHSKVHGGGELDNIPSLSISMATDIGVGYPQLLGHLSCEELDGYAEQLLASMKNLSPSSEVVTDKMPHNFFFIPLIHKLFPRAKIIHCVRDPIDTCLSCYFQHFGGHHPYAYNLSNLGAYYQHYVRLMNHWTETLHVPIYEVRYEDLVSDPKKGVVELLNYLDLEWEDSCMEFHKQNRAINTASYAQVKRKIYKSSVSRWLNYKPYISELLDALK